VVRERQDGERAAPPELAIAPASLPESNPVLADRTEPLGNLRPVEGESVDPPAAEETAQEPLPAGQLPGVVTERAAGEPQDIAPGIRREVEERVAALRLSPEVGREESELAEAILQRGRDERAQVILQALEERQMAITFNNRGRFAVGLVPPMLLDTEG